MPYEKRIYVLSRTYIKSIEYYIEYNIRSICLRNFLQIFVKASVAKFMFCKSLCFQHILMNNIFPLCRYNKLSCITKYVIRSGTANVRIHLIPFINAMRNKVLASSIGRDKVNLPRPVIQLQTTFFELSLRFHFNLCNAYYICHISFIYSQQI